MAKTPAKITTDPNGDVLLTFVDEDGFPVTRRFRCRSITVMEVMDDGREVTVYWPEFEAKTQPESWNRVLNCSPSDLEEKIRSEHQRATARRSTSRKRKSGNRMYRVLRDIKHTPEGVRSTAERLQARLTDDVPLTADCVADAAEMLKRYADLLKAGRTRPDD